MLKTLHTGGVFSFELLSAYAKLIVMKQKPRVKSAFTVIELIVVVLIVAVLAVLVIVGYGAVVNNAKTASIQTDLSNNAKLLRIYKIQNGSYPTALDAQNCPTLPKQDTNSCLKTSGTNSIYSYVGGAGSFTLKINNGSLAYQIGDSGSVGTTTVSAPTTFIKTYGITSSVDDYSHYAQQTSDGGIISVGCTGSADWDASITKYDSLGNVTWSKKWGGSGNDLLYKVVQTTDGGYAGAGYTYSSGAGDALIVKYDSSGNFQWAKTWGGANVEEGYNIAQTSDGSLVVTGITAGSFGSSTADAFLIKLTSAGALSWQKQWGLTGGTVSGHDDGESLAVTSDDGFIVVGETGSIADFDVNLTKFDSSGNISWAKLYRTATSQTGFNVIQTSDGGYAITGSTAWLGDSTSNAAVIKVNSTGSTVTWSKSWGGAQNDMGYELVQTSDGGYAVTGRTSSYGAGGVDSFLLKLGSNGAQSWAKTWGGTSDDYGYGLSRNSSDNLFVAGYTNGYGVGSYDSVLLKYDSGGNITNCNTTTMCITPASSVSDLAITIQTPTINTPAVSYSIINAPSGTGSDYNPSIVTIVSP